MQGFPLPKLPYLSVHDAMHAQALLTPDGHYDAVVLVGAAPFAELPSEGHYEVIARVLETQLEIDRGLAGQGPTLSVAAADGAPGRRLIISTTGDLGHDSKDVRSFAEAARAGVGRARDCGAKKPLLIICPTPDGGRFDAADEVAVLGAMSTTWIPLEARFDETLEPVFETIGVLLLDGNKSVDQDAIHALEVGRAACRDITGTEPELMSPEGIAAYCEDAFDGTDVEVRVERDFERIEHSYPLLAGVARACAPVERHHPRIVRLQYRGEGEWKRTIFLAGKGVTYDTGGADVKYGGHMAGMSRDKGGAGAVIGLMRWLAEARPKGIRVVGMIGAVRNSIGSNGYVTDEVIASRAGVRVRIGNTDAEGRLVLADLLAALREEAEKTDGAIIMSIATLTGHAYRAYGPYSIVCENGPARAGNLGKQIQEAGDRFGDPFEVSRIRREDYAFVRPRTAAEDVVSGNSEPSTQTPRGHQFPFAFLDIASGLEAHGLGAGDKALPFLHIDIGGSAVEGGDWQFGTPTAAPLVALAKGLFR